MTHLPDRTRRQLKEAVGVPAFLAALIFLLLMVSQLWAAVV